MVIRNCFRYSAIAFMAVAAFAAEHRGLVKFGGLPVPGATVTATRGDKKIAAITDAQGAYSFPDLRDGTWVFEVEMLGFSPLRSDVDVAATVASTREWDLKMLPLDEIRAEVRKAPEPAAAAAPAAKSNTRALATRPTDQAPAAGPAPPPVDYDPELIRKAADGFLINGSVHNGNASPFAQSAAFGNRRKGPPPQYSGNLGFTLDNSALNARAFSLTGQDTPKPGYNRFQGLLSFGGPLRIPHLLKNGPSLTINYQWTRNRNATTQYGLVPTAAERAGDLSRLVTTARSALDPTTGAPFSGGFIPLARISPQALSLLSLYPLPNFEGGSRYNFQLPLLDNLHQDNLQTRWNKSAGRRNQFFGTFALQSSRSDDTSLLGFLDASSITGLNSGVSWRHAFNQRLFLTMGYQYSRFMAHSKPFFSDRRNISAEAGITGNSQDPRDWGPPGVFFGGGFLPLTDARYSVTRNQTSAFSSDVFLSRGRHNLSMGGDFKRQQFNPLSQQDGRGTFTFTGAAAGNDFAGFLLGVPDASSINYGNYDKYLRSNLWDAYFTDDWRARPGFTVNAGMRWEYSSPITEKYGRLANLNIAPGFAAATPVLAGRGSSLLHPDRTGFEPRIGFSWRPFSASSMVVRGGYGIYYDTSVYLPIAAQLAVQPPLSKSFRVQNSAALPLTLANGFLAPVTGGTPSTFAVDPNFQVGYSQNWQLSIQRDLPFALVLTAQYLGIKGTRGVQQFLPNTYPLGATNPCPSCPSGFTYMTSNGNSTRESGQIQLRRRLRSGLTADFQYTFSKSLDNAALGGRGQGVALIAQNWLDLSAERGRSSFDQRHQVSFQTQYTTGARMKGGSLDSGRLGMLLREWTVVTAINAATGLPLTPTYLAVVNGTGVTGTIRPDYTGAPLHAAPPGLFLNPAAYRAPQPGHWGNAGRASITGPGQFNLNASLGRTIRINDRLSGDLRFDAQNALNHPTFPAWVTAVTSAQFGLPLQANSMRSIQTTFRLRF